jgi:hypothetical protein
MSSKEDSVKLEDAIQLEVESRHHEAPWFIIGNKRSGMQSLSEFYLEKIIEARRALNQPLSNRFISEVRESIR